jgi:hypothetical protein
MSDGAGPSCAEDDDLAAEVNAFMKRPSALGAPAAAAPKCVVSRRLAGWPATHATHACALRSTHERAPRARVCSCRLSAQRCSARGPFRRRLRVR